MTSPGVSPTQRECQSRKSPRPTRARSLVRRCRRCAGRKGSCLKGASFTGGNLATSPPTPHFIASFAVLAILGSQTVSRREVPPLLPSFLTMLGLAGYILRRPLPHGWPPRMALSSRFNAPGSKWFSAGQLVDGRHHVLYGARYANRVAAMPLLHGGWSMLIASLRVAHSSCAAKPLCFLYPAVMLFTLVVGGEHTSLMSWLASSAPRCLWLMTLRERHWPMADVGEAASVDNFDNPQASPTCSPQG
ncbi:MAG: phosphatase PAP2 family protein [Acidimicrobiales bacterium]